MLEHFSISDKAFIRAGNDRFNFLFAVSFFVYSTIAGKQYFIER